MQIAFLALSLVLYTICFSGFAGGLISLFFRREQRVKIALSVIALALIALAGYSLWHHAAEIVAGLQEFSTNHGLLAAGLVGGAFGALGGAAGAVIGGLFPNKARDILSMIGVALGFVLSRAVDLGISSLG